MFRATKIAGYVKAMKSRGISASQLLAGTRIDSKLLASQDYLISLEQYHAVVSNMMKLTGDPGVAFSLADIANLNEIGIVGYAMISSTTLRQALDVWIKYSNTLVGTPIQVQSFHDISPGYELVISSSSKAGVFNRFESEELLVQGMKLVRDLTGVKPVIGEVSFAYPKPRHFKRYETYCECKARFDAPATTFRVLHPDLDAPIQTENEELFRVCSEHCNQVMKTLPDGNLVRSRLRSHFLSTPSKLPDLAAASAALGMSVSSLRRSLDAGGQSYQELKDQFRFDLAREYLSAGHMTPKQVSHLLGFTSPSTFSRAFKSWTGQTVGQFLQR